MPNIVFKVAPRGEGKTRWLLEVARKESRNHKVYLLTTDGNELAKFCDKYFAVYHEVCPVQKFYNNEVDPDGVILIDNLMSHAISTTNIEFYNRQCYKMFITLEGVTEYISSISSYIPPVTYNQITFDDYEVALNG